MDREKNRKSCLQITRSIGNIDRAPAFELSAYRDTWVFFYTGKRVTGQGEIIWKNVKSGQGIRKLIITIQFCCY